MEAYVPFLTAALAGLGVGIIAEVQTRPKVPAGPPPDLVITPPGTPTPSRYRCNGTSCIPDENGDYDSESACHFACSALDQPARGVFMAAKYGATPCPASWGNVGHAAQICLKNEDNAGNQLITNTPLGLDKDDVLGFSVPANSVGGSGVELGKPTDPSGVNNWQAVKEGDEASIKCTNPKNGIVNTPSHVDTIDTPTGRVGIYRCHAIPQFKDCSPTACNLGYSDLVKCDNNPTSLSTKFVVDFPGSSNEQGFCQVVANVSSWIVNCCSHFHHPDDASKKALQVVPINNTNASTVTLVDGNTRFNNTHGVLQAYEYGGPYFRHFQNPLEPSSQFWVMPLTWVFNHDPQHESKSCQDGTWYYLAGAITFSVVDGAVKLSPGVDSDGRGGIVAKMNIATRKLELLCQNFTTDENVRKYYLPLMQFMPSPDV